MRPAARGTTRPPRRRRATARAARGFTLIDVLVLLVLLALVAGSLTALFARLGSASALALREREALTVALALVEEASAMPFTFCDADDARVRTATAAVVGPAGCAGLVDALGPEPGESRYGPARFDHVSDYAGLVMPGPGCAGGLCLPDGTLINPPGSALAGCSARVDVTPQALPGIAALDANGRPQALRVSARLRCPGRADAVAEAVRVRHAPREP
jgi:MSHA pilin protein MshD